jgi:hypothetical protein
MLREKSWETKHVALEIKGKLNMLGEKPQKLNLLDDKSWETKHAAGETPRKQHVCR